MMLALLSDYSPFEQFWLFLFLLGSYVLIVGLELCALYLIFYLLTLPMRRREQARIFLDMLEFGLQEGRTPEAAVVGASASRDASLGVRFHLLAAHLDKGERLTEGLARVPRVLPPQVIAMLKAGERIGDISKVLPACRRLLSDGVSQVRGALNYLLVLAFLVTPFTLFVPFMLYTMVIPKFRDVFGGIMEGAPLPAFTVFIFSAGNIVMPVLLGLIIFVWLLVIAYVSGPRFTELLRRVLPGVPDWIQFELPWRRKRLQRDFSAMLAVLLDAGVPEAEAIAMAADATANAPMRRRAEKIRALIQSGVKLPVAIRALDDSKELQWRLTNALQHGRGFLAALTGWHESLDAKAFQLEQTAAQVTTTALVLINGFIVACIVIAVFITLVSLINQATLW